MAATSRGDVAMVELLLAAGADVHAKSAFGKTACEIADQVKDGKVRGKLKKMLGQ